MSAPRLGVPLVLEAPVRVPDGLGGHRTSWQVLGTLWGEPVAALGGEGRGEVGALSAVPWRVKLRGAPEGDPRRPRAGQRLRHGTRLLRIEAVAEADPAGRFLTCVASEEVTP